MVLSLPFILAFIGSAVGLIIGMVIYGDISEAIECPASDGGGGGGGPIGELFNTLGLETTSSNLIFNFATNGDVGKLVTLSGQQIHSIRIENLDTQGVDIGYLTAKIWSDVTVGQPNKVEEARSETIIFDNILAMDNYNATFNFTTTPVLSGSDIVIGLTYYFDDNAFFPTIESDVGGNEGVLVATYGGFNTIGQDCGGSCQYSNMQPYQFIGQLISMSDQSAYSLRFEDIDSTLTNAGKLRAVVYSNVVEGEGISNSTLEATSDFIDLSDPQYAFNSDIDITFNFTTPVYLTGIDDIFIGLNSYDKSPNESITAPNAGTFGSSADGIYFVNNIETNFVDITGIINQGVRQGSGGQESEIRYDFDGTSAWNFLHTLSGDNKTSINFWVRGDIDQPDSVTLIDTTGGSNNGFVLYTDTGEINLYLLEESTEIIYGIFSLGIPPDDSNWHLISLMMDKGNTTNFAKLCIDGSTNCQSLNIDNQFSGSGSDADYTLTIGSSHFTSTEFEFDVDDVT